MADQWRESFNVQYKNPAAIFSVPGTYDVTLIVTDGTLSDTITKTIVIDGVSVQSLPIAEGFEQGQFDANWLLTQWSINEEVGGYGLSDHCMYYDNYDSDLQEVLWTCIRQSTTSAILRMRD